MPRRFHELRVPERVKREMINPDNCASAMAERTKVRRWLPQEVTGLSLHESSTHMSTAKKSTQPVDVIHEDSGPPLTGEQEQQKDNGVDIDDAQIQAPKDDAFKKPAQPEAEPKRRRKKA